jgi:hypothetical protein
MKISNSVQKKNEFVGSKAKFVKSILKKKKPTNFQIHQSSKLEMPTPKEKIKFYFNITDSDFQATEYADLDLNQLKKEKEENLKELYKTLAEIENLNYHFNKKFFYGKALERENELRNHIKNLNDKLGTKEVEEVKTTIQDLYHEITGNIVNIQENMKNEIQVKKKDIENRINMRLLDTEVKHKKVIEDKIREQDDMLRQLNAFTSEMSKIKENYDIARKKINTLYLSNIDTQKKIQEEEKRNRIIKIQMKQYKIFLNDLKRKVSEMNNKDNNLMIIPKPDSSKREKNQRIETEEQITKPQTNYNTTSNNLNTCNNITNSRIDKSVCKLTNRQKTLNNKCKYLNNEDEIIDTHNFLKTPHILTQTLNSLKQKMQTVRMKHDDTQSSVNPLTKRVNEIIDILRNDLSNDIYNMNIKSNLLHSHKMNPKSYRNNPMSNFNLNFISESYVSTHASLKKNEMNNFTKEDRIRLIDRLTRDRHLISLIENEKFPTVNSAFRKVNFK